MNIQQYKEVANPMHSLNEYFKNRENNHPEEYEEYKGENGKYFVEIRGSRTTEGKKTRDVYITFEHDDTKLNDVKRFVHFVDAGPVSVSAQINPLMIDFNNPLNNKDDILNNIISELKVVVAGGKARRRIQTNKNKRKQHRKKYSIKKRK
jgi:hypothetical protein